MDQQQERPDIGIKDHFQFVSNPLFEVEANVTYDNLFFELDKETTLESCDKIEDDHRTWDPGAPPISKVWKQPWEQQDKPK